MYSVYSHTSPLESAEMYLGHSNQRLPKSKWPQNKQTSLKQNKHKQKTQPQNNQNTHTHTQKKKTTKKKQQPKTTTIHLQKCDNITWRFWNCQASPPSQLWPPGKVSVLTGWKRKKNLLNLPNTYKNIKHKVRLLFFCVGVSFFSGPLSWATVYISTNPYVLPVANLVFWSF